MRLWINLKISIFGRKISMKIQRLNAEKKPLQNSKQYVYAAHYRLSHIFRFQLKSNLLYYHTERYTDEDFMRLFRVFQTE